MKPTYDQHFYQHMPFLPGVPIIGNRLEEKLLALNWETKKTARHKYFIAQNPTEYSYGNSFSGDQVYHSKPLEGPAASILRHLNERFKLNYTGCFLNKYDDEKQHLGWHADDFPGMDPDHPIAVMSFGAEREIWVKPKFEDCPTCQGTGLVSENGEDNIICGHCHGYCTGKPVKGIVPPEDRYLLHRGSLFVMPGGYQERYYHRIPKHPQPCGYRISLTFRSFK